MNTSSKFHVSQLNNHSAITQTMQAKGAIKYVTLQGYIIFEMDLYTSYIIQ